MLTDKTNSTCIWLEVFYNTRFVSIEVRPLKTEIVGITVIPVIRFISNFILLLLLLLRLLGDLVVEFLPRCMPRTIYQLYVSSIIKLK